MAPAAMKNRYDVEALGCASFRYTLATLNADLAFVDAAAAFDRGSVPLSAWVDQWVGLNGDMATFNAYMHNKVGAR
jgi:hypothetical protein